MGRVRSIVTKSRRVIVARLEPGERVVESVEGLARQHAVRGGVVTMIGGLACAQVGFFQPAQGKYAWTMYEGFFECLAGVGNVAWRDGRPVVHLHITLALPDGRVVGGHCGPETTIAVTGEVQLVETETRLTRAEDPRWQVGLLDLPEE